MNHDEYAAHEWREFWFRAETLNNMSDAWTASGLLTGQHRVTSLLRLTNMSDLSLVLQEAEDDGLLRPVGEIGWPQTSNAPLVSWYTTDGLMPTDYGAIGWHADNMKQEDSYVTWTTEEASALHIDFFSRVHELRQVAKAELAILNVTHEPHALRGVFISGEGILEILGFPISNPHEEKFHCVSIPFQAITVAHL